MSEAKPVKDLAQIERDWMQEELQKMKNIFTAEKILYFDAGYQLALTRMKELLEWRGKE